MHAVAERTDRELLPATVAALLDRNDQRRADRAQAWRQHTAQNRAREAAYQRLTATRQQAAPANAAAPQPRPGLRPRTLRPATVVLPLLASVDFVVSAVAATVR